MVCVACPVAQVDIGILVSVYDKPERWKQPPSGRTTTRYLPFKWALLLCSALIRSEPPYPSTRGSWGGERKECLLRLDRWRRGDERTQHWFLRYIHLLVRSCRSISEPPSCPHWLESKTVDSTPRPWVCCQWGRAATYHDLEGESRFQISAYPNMWSPYTNPVTCRIAPWLLADCAGSRRRKNSGSPLWCLC